jgi:predicted nuclease with TOPRIM domain
MQSQIEELELRYKTELSRVKSKLQNELDEIRLRYESLKKVKGELENHLKKLQGTVKDAQDRLIEEQAAHNATRDLLSASEKRFGKFSFSKRKSKQFIIHSILGLIHSEIEELRVFLDRVCYFN